VNAIKDKKDWYCIKFDVPRNRNITALEFSKKMNSFLEQINEFNHSIVNGIDDTYTVASYIEDFESGSIKWWLLDKLNKIDDTAIDKFVDSPIKTTIAIILKTSKKKAIDRLNSDDYKQLSPEERKIKIINPIIEEIESKKEAFDENFLIPKDIRIDEDRLLKSLAKMSEISRELEENVSFINDYDNQDEQIIISKDLNYNDFINTSNIAELEEQRILQSTNIIEDVYILLTPTSKDDCKWEFDDNGSKIKCTMKDIDFFNKYCSNQEKLGGNEKLKIRMKIETFLENNKIKKEYTILEIIEKIPDRTLFNWQNINKSS
jgi:hypothetical protein